MLMYFVKGIVEYTFVTVVIKSNIYLSLRLLHFVSQDWEMGSRKVFGKVKH